MRAPSVAGVLGARIRERRTALAWSQAKLAELIDVTPNYLGTLERGQALPTVQTLVALAGVLETTPADLLGGGNGGDEWVEGLVAVATTIPVSQRQLAMALLRAVAAHHGVPAEGERLSVKRPAGPPKRRR
jgi:transcriptional regulator with XRE-family HTH domain